MTTEQANQLQAIYDRLYELEDFAGSIYYFNYIYDNPSGTGIYSVLKDDFNATLTLPGYWKLSSGNTVLIDDENMKVYIHDIHHIDITFKRKGTYKPTNSTLPTIYNENEILYINNLYSITPLRILFE